MSEAKFTQGPWHIVDDSKFCMKDIFITSEKRQKESKAPICELDIYFNEPMFTEASANAKLIAAAPDMYGALEKACQMLERARRGCDDCDNCPIKVALDKVRDNG